MRPPTPLSSLPLRLRCSRLTPRLSVVTWYRAGRLTLTAKEGSWPSTKRRRILNRRYLAGNQPKTFRQLHLISFWWFPPWLNSHLPNYSLPHSLTICGDSSFLSFLFYFPSYFVSLFVLFILIFSFCLLSLSILLFSLKRFLVVVYDLGKKMDSTFGGHILVKSKPIFKNHMRFESAKKFPPIWDLARLCSFIRLEVRIKNVNSVLARNARNEK